MLVTREDLITPLFICPFLHIKKNRFDVLDEILDFIESVSESLPTCS